MDLDHDDEGTDGAGEETATFVPFSAYVITRDQYSTFKVFEKLLPKLQDKIDKYELVGMPKGKRVSPEFEVHVERIKSEMLPSLPRKLCSICDKLFSPTYFQTNDAPEYESAMKVLREVDETIDQIADSMDGFWIPENRQSRHAIHLEKPRDFRCQTTQLKLSDLFRDVEELFELFCSLIPLSEFRTIMRRSAKIAWGQLVEDTHYVCRSIDNLARSFERSDLGLVQDEWQAIVQEFDDLLEELVEFPLHNPNIRFEPLKAFVPIIKLSRLFFNKLSKQINGHIHPITQFTPSQIFTLKHSAAHIPRFIKQFFYDIEYRFTPQRRVQPKVAFHLVSHFHVAIQSLYYDINHLAANPDYSFETCQKFLLWYTDWQSLYSLAVRRFYTTYRDVYSDFLFLPPPQL